MAREAIARAGSPRRTRTAFVVVCRAIYHPWQLPTARVAQWFNVTERTVRRWRRVGIELSYAGRNPTREAWEDFERERPGCALHNAPSSRGQVSTSEPVRLPGKGTGVDRHLSAVSRALAARRHAS